jgi:hypothetical protein
VQIRTKQQQLEQQGSKLRLPEVTSKLQQQHDQLQAKLQQLTATLTDSKQANACMRARVDAAIADTKTQLQASTVSFTGALTGRWTDGPRTRTGKLGPWIALVTTPFDSTMQDVHVASSWSPAFFQGLLHQSQHIATAMVCAATVSIPGLWAPPSTLRCYIGTTTVQYRQ